jgi:bifunctional DNase/RNase
MPDTSEGDMAEQRVLRAMAIRTAVLLWLVGAIAAQALGSDQKQPPDVVAVKVLRLVMDPQSSQPVVALADLREERALLIWIDFSEAQAMEAEIEGIKHPRPLTHDLLERIIQATHSRVDHIVITELRENVFYAILALHHEGALVEIDARPSDSIIMALKFKAPIYVAKRLFEDMSVSLGEQQQPDDYGVSLQDLTPALAEYFSYSSDRGVLVSAVRKGSRADQDGIAAGDIIVEVGGRSVENVESVKEAISRSKTPVEAKIFRNNKILVVTLHRK